MVENAIIFQCYTCKKRGKQTNGSIPNTPYMYIHIDIQSGKKKTFLAYFWYILSKIHQCQNKLLKKWSSTNKRARFLYVQLKERDLLHHTNSDQLTKEKKTKKSFPQRRLNWNPPGAHLDASATTIPAKSKRPKFPKYPHRKKQSRIHKASKRRRLSAAKDREFSGFRRTK